MAQRQSRSAWVRIVLAVAAAPLGLVAGSISAAPAPTTLPADVTSVAASPASSDAAIDRAISELGSDDADARERATRSLWELAPRSEPALRRAAQSPEPEVAGRARSLLRSLAFGLRPDTPPIVSNLLQGYLAGDAQQKQAAIEGLAQNSVAGARVLLELYRAEPEGRSSEAILHALSSMSRAVCQQLITGGEVEVAGKLLDAVANEGEAAARDRAAFVLLGGRIDEEVRKVATQAHPGADATTRLIYLLRARGNVAEAAKAANDAPSVPTPGTTVSLAEAMLAEAGDWKRLETRLTGDNAVDAPRSIEDLSLLVGYARLAEDTAAVDRWVAKVVQVGMTDRDRYPSAVEILLLNGRPAAAVEILRKQNDFAALAEYLSLQLRYKDVLAITDHATLTETGPAKLRLQAAEALHFAGRPQEAAAVLDGVASGTSGGVDTATLGSLLMVARMTSQPRAKIDAWLSAALEGAKLDEPIEPLFEKGGFDHPDLAAKWWPILRRRGPDDDAATKLRRLRQLDRGELTAAEVETTISDAVAEGTSLPAAQRDVRLLLAGETYAVLKLPEKAAKTYAQLESLTGDADTLRRCADYHADASDWTAAASLYSRAVGLAPTNNVGRYLYGLALGRSGQVSKGEAIVAAVDYAALSDETLRHALLEAAARRGFKPEAAHQRELLVRLGDPRSWEVADARRRAGDEAHGDGRFLEAVDEWEHAFLENLRPGVTFVETSANLTIPAIVHADRARGLFRAGKIDEGMKEAGTFFEIWPGDADTLINLVDDLQDLKHPAEADAFYHRALGYYEALLRDYPASAGQQPGGVVPEPLPPRPGHRPGPRSKGGGP